MGEASSGLDNRKYRGQLVQFVVLDCVFPSTEISKPCMTLAVVHCVLRETHMNTPCMNISAMPCYGLL